MRFFTESTSYEKTIPSDLKGASELLRDAACRLCRLGKDDFRTEDIRQVL